MTSGVDPKLLEILVCPLCKGKLVYRKEAHELVCRPDRLAYPVKDGIPVMLEEEARKLRPEEEVTCSSASSFPRAMHRPASRENPWSTSVASRWACGYASAPRKAAQPRCTSPRTTPASRTRCARTATRR